MRIRDGGLYTLHNGTYADESDMVPLTEHLHRKGVVCTSGVDPVVLVLGHQWTKEDSCMCTITILIGDRTVEIDVVDDEITEVRL